MKTHALTYGKKAIGRPPVADLSAADLQEIRSQYLATNLNKKEGSILLAWVRFCESRPDLAHLVENHMPATTIPVAVVEACRKARPLVGPARGGAPRLLHESAYVPGTMRRHHQQARRLQAGERASVDDATRNTACYIPWPWGGCPTSDKYGVKLGRWQTLVVHDDATGFVPFVSSVFRHQQSYRATDAASVIYRAESQVCQWEAWAIEGGVWQAKRTLAVLGSRFISAKGRPNQKLVENYFGRLWTIMAGQPGDVGRHRGEMKAASDLYIQARQGRVDPRKHFLSLSQAQETMYAAIQYLNEKRMDSRTYGSWVPQTRWEADMEELQLQPRATADDFLILPIAETRKVRRGMIRVTEDGPQGVPMIWSFAADWLWEYEGREATVYFDPLAAWPVEATVTLKGERKPLGKIECVNPLDCSKDRAIEIAKSIRQTMMAETRVLLTRHTERTVRHQDGVLHAISATTGTECPHVDTPAEITAERANETPRVPAIQLPDRLNLTTSRDLRETTAAAPRITRDDLASSLSRRAARLRGEEIPA